MPLLCELQNKLLELCYRHKNCLVHFYLQEPFLTAVLHLHSLVRFPLNICIHTTAFSIPLFKESQQEPTCYIANSYFGLRDTPAVQASNSWRASKNDEWILFIFIFTWILCNREETKIHISEGFFSWVRSVYFCSIGLKYTKYPSKLKTAQASFRWVISNYKYMETAQFLIMERKHCQDIHKDGELCRLEDRQRDATEMYWFNCSMTKLRANNYFATGNKRQEPAKVDPWSAQWFPRETST